jgi:hypothetical protein
MVTPAYIKKTSGHNINATYKTVVKPMDKVQIPPEVIKGLFRQRSKL